MNIFQTNLVPCNAKVIILYNKSHQRLMISYDVESAYLFLDLLTYLIAHAY